MTPEEAAALEVLRAHGWLVGKRSSIGHLVECGAGEPFLMLGYGDPDAVRHERIVVSQSWRPAEPAT